MYKQGPNNRLMPTTRKGQPGPGGHKSATKTRTPGKHRSAAGSSTTAKTPGTSSSSCSTSCSGAATTADREARLDKLEVRVKHIQLQVEEARKLEALETKFRAQGLLRRLDDLEANFSELETRCSETMVRRCELTEATVDALRVDASASLTAFRERVNEVLKSLQESFKARFAQTRDQNAAQLERALAHAGSLEHEIGVLDESLRAAQAETHELARRLRTSEALVHELQQEQRRQSGQIQSLLGLVNRMQQQNYQRQQQSPRWESQGQDQQRIRSFVMR